MTTPPQLAAAIEKLPSSPRIEFAGGWQKFGNAYWHIRFRARLSVEPIDVMPEWTAWHLVLWPVAGGVDMDIYPAVEGGIEDTFAHQEFNKAWPDDRPWTKGKPCLERPAATFRRDGWSGEPLDMAGRIAWRLDRLLGWIDAAAKDELVVPGDPLELPVLPDADTFKILGFSEREEDFDAWLSLGRQWGLATLAALPGARDTHVVTDFMDPQLHSLREVRWSKAIKSQQNGVDAVWVLLPSLPVGRPWRSALTWQELSAWCVDHHVDLPAILEAAGARLRRIQTRMPSRPVHLILGFPIGERAGDEPTLLHWLAISNLKLCSREDVRRGFRNIETARKAWDRKFAVAPRPITWRTSRNYAPDQIRRRGSADALLRSKRVLVIGAGAIGSAVASNLLRMGVTRLGVIDEDTLVVGNLVRHSLGMADVGWKKADGLANHLNLTMPDADVVAFSNAFPPTDKKQIAEMAKFDVIVDCSGSDDVLRAMAAFPWCTERHFVSLSMTWRAKGLFAFSASEAAFPAHDAIERFAGIADAPAEAEDWQMEGIGCWHPVFPALADDVQLWAAMGTKFIRRAIETTDRLCELYEQQDDGTVDRTSL